MKKIISFISSKVLFVKTKVLHVKDYFDAKCAKIFSTGFMMFLSSSVFADDWKNGVKSVYENITDLPLKIIMTLGTIGCAAGFVWGQQSGEGGAFKKVITTALGLGAVGCAGGLVSTFLGAGSIALPT